MSANTQTALHSELCKPSLMLSRQYFPYFSHVLAHAAMPTVLHLKTPTMLFCLMGSGGCQCENWMLFLPLDYGIFSLKHVGTCPPVSPTHIEREVWPGSHTRKDSYANCLMASAGTLNLQHYQTHS